MHAFAFIDRYQICSSVIGGGHPGWHHPGGDTLIKMWNFLRLNLQPPSQTISWKAETGGSGDDD